MRRGLAAVVAVAACLLAVAGAAPAAAKTTAKATVTTEDGATRLMVTVTTSGRFSARTRPRSVSVRHGRTTYKLKAARTRAARASSVWRSAAFRGSRGRALARLARKQVTVSVRSRAGTQTFRSRVASTPPQGPGGGNPGGQDPGGQDPGTQRPLFEAPSSELTGNAAYDHIRRYLVDSRFTDCPAGWPACSVEERYNHCADGTWEYHRLTPSSGSDIHTYGNPAVTDAVARTDGSWGVEYFADGDKRTQFYSWNVAADGTVTGSYFFDGQFSQTLGPLVWQQPAGC